MIVTEHSPTKKMYAAIVSYRTDLRSDLVCIDENEKRLLKANSATHRETISPVKLPSVIPNPFMEVSTMMVNPSKLEEVFSMWGELLFIGIKICGSPANVSRFSRSIISPYSDRLRPDAGR